MYTNFGDFFSAKRKALKLTLREFCRLNNFDAGNISKLERGILPPPQTEEKKLQYANALGIKKGTDEWLEFCDLATISGGKIPDDILSDKELLASVPVFFRSIRKEGVDNNKIRDLLKTIEKELK
jgi:transcriptional regulator with XRE-family HTH domain